MSEINFYHNKKDCDLSINEENLLLMYVRKAYIADIMKIFSLTSSKLDKSINRAIKK